MSAIDQLFAQLRSTGRKAFMPFVVAGDPDLEFTAAVVKELASCGCTLAEIGIPYSDPIADGPVIQAAYTRALARQLKVQQILSAVQPLSRAVTMPLVAMVSYAIIHRHGLERFVDEAQEAGFAGAIVPDLLVEEAGPLAQSCRRADFSLIQLVTPTTPHERAVRIAEQSTGFLYYVSITGITGERRDLPPELVDSVSRLRAKTSLPICIGFGISKPEHIRLLSPVADGFIVGSALVRLIAAADSQPREQVLRQVGELASTLIAAM
jgi:tryptophan synthase alpha chain